MINIENRSSHLPLHTVTMILFYYTYDISFVLFFCSFKNFLTFYFVTSIRECMNPTRKHTSKPLTQTVSYARYTLFCQLCVCEFEFSFTHNIFSLSFCVYAREVKTKLFWHQSKRSKKNKFKRQQEKMALKLEIRKFYWNKNCKEDQREYREIPRSTHTKLNRTYIRHFMSPWKLASNTV